MVHSKDTLHKGKWQNQETIKICMKPDMIILLLYPHKPVYPYGSPYAVCFPSNNKKCILSHTKVK